MRSRCQWKVFYFRQVENWKKLRFVRIFLLRHSCMLKPTRSRFPSMRMDVLNGSVHTRRENLRACVGVVHRFCSKVENFPPNFPRFGISAPSKHDALAAKESWKIRSPCKDHACWGRAFLLVVRTKKTIEQFHEFSTTTGDFPRFSGIATSVVFR